ncbi:anti-sigma factor antagonist [Streptomyces sp. NPDC001595]|uniref:anti-sigma factor antagonist n=1 Tax=Streptomyces sp. NPDC001532 TaxID=3154520 RepID=UPI00331EC45C
MQQEPAPISRYLRVLQDRGHTVLEFHGEIDIVAAEEIAPWLDEATAAPAPQVVIDLGPAVFLDASGLRLLYRARSRVLARDGRLHLVCAHPPVLRVLRVAGLTRLLPPLPTREAALHRPGSPAR